LEALSEPAFATPADCTPWVIGGLWPVELQNVTPDTVEVAEYLKNDLRRIADSANEKLRALQHRGVPEGAHRAEEARIIEGARAFAVLRVESTVRQLREEILGFGLEPPGQTAVAEPQPPEPNAVEEPQPPVAGGVCDDGGGPAAAPPVDVPVESSLKEPEPEPVGSGRDEERPEKIVEFVARQEPGLRWAAGRRGDGTVLLVTDLAHGWIPAGITLPTGVELLSPAKRGGRVAEVLGEVEHSVIYHPGDPFDRTAPYEDIATSPEARRLPPVEDLGWRLGEATHWRDGLPRMVHTLAKAGAAGTGVLDAEIDVLRVHADTARYQLLAQYPDVDAALLCNCLLLAATEAIATGDELSANYHFAWFEVLSAPSATQWVGQT